MSGLTVPRTESLLRNRTREVVSVRRFGAKGDGTFNNLTAFRDTLAAANDGDTITIPPGDHLIEYQEASGNASVFDLVGRKDLTFIGEKGSRITVKHDVTGGSQFHLFSGPAENCKFIGLDIDWESFTTTPTGSESRGVPFYFVHEGGVAPQNIHIDACRIKTTHPEGANMGGGPLDGKMGSVWFHGDYHGETYAHGLRVTNCDFVDSRGRVLWTWYAENMLIQGNSFVNCGGHTLCRILTGCRDFRITENYIQTRFDEFTAAAITYSGQGGDTARDALIANNTFKLGRSSAIWVLGVSRCRIANNSIAIHPDYTGATYDGIRVSEETTSGGRPTEYIDIVGNTVVHPSPYTVVGGVKFVSFIGNTFIGEGGTSVNGLTPPIDVVWRANRFEGGGRPRPRGLRVTLTDNVIEGMTANLGDDWSGVRDVTIRDNQIINPSRPSGQSVIDLAGSGHVVEGNRITGGDYDYGVKARFPTGGTILVGNNDIDEGREGVYDLHANTKVRGVLATREVVSVRGFGAVGNNVVDDTSAFQEAIDAVDGRVLVPFGTYRVRELKPNPTTNRLELVGANGAVLRGFVGGGGDRIGILLDGSDNVELSLRGITMEDFELGIWQHPDYSGFVTFAASQCVFDGVERCVWMTQGVAGATIRGNEFRNITRSETDSIGAIVLGDVSDSNTHGHTKADMGTYIIENNTFDGIDSHSLGGPTRAIWTWGGHLIASRNTIRDVTGSDASVNNVEAIHSASITSNIHHNDISNAGSGQSAIVIKSNDSGSIIDNTIVGGNAGIYCDSPEFEIAHNRVLGIKFRVSGSPEGEGTGIQIRVNNVNRVNVDHNRVESSGRFGILFRGWGRDNSVSNNRVRCVEDATWDGAVDGIRFSFGVSHTIENFTADGNHLTFDDFDDSRTIEPMIWLFQSGVNSIKNASVSGNRIVFRNSDAATRKQLNLLPLNDSASSTADGFRVEENVIIGQSSDAFTARTDLGTWSNVTISRNSWDAVYTVATLPDSSSRPGIEHYVGAIVYVADGAAGSPVMAYCDGTDWLRVDTGTAVSSS